MTSREYRPWLRTIDRVLELIRQEGYTILDQPREGVDKGYLVLRNPERGDKVKIKCWLNAPQQEK